MSYDTLNRLTARIVDSVLYGQRPSGISGLGGLPTVYAPYKVPVDTQRFTYDIMGRMRTANNSDARVSRAYYSNGLLQTETDSLRTVQNTDFTRHVYQLQFSYDLDGRRTALGVPSQLDPQGVGSITLSYQLAWGALGSIAQGTDNFSFAYNARAEQRSISFPGNWRQAHAYDADGRLVADTVQRQGYAPSRSSSYEYDDRDRLVLGADPGGFLDTLRMAYSGLGHVVHSTFSEWSKMPLCNSRRYVNDETFAYDALGNQSESHSTESVLVTCGSNQQTNGTNSTYTPGTGRLSSTNGQGSSTSFSYDSAGNTEFSQNLGTPSREQASYYAADGMLRATDTRNAATFHNGQWWNRAFDEYRYDALGRRIWVRSQKSCLPGGMNFVASTECQTSILRRVIWDGSDLLAEIQMPGGAGDGSYWENDVAAVTLPPLSVSGGLGDPSRYFGRVIYAHAFGIDHPLAVTRYNFVRAVDDQGNPISPAEVIPWARFMPFWDVLGSPSLNAFTTGEEIYCPGPANQCEGVFSPYTFSAYDREHGNAGRNNWQGSLLESGQDKSGLQFRRNRYYDPQTGQFTQEDPIGLAGGLNLYGFAGGDPINFSDPFGLTACPDKDGKEVPCPEPEGGPPVELPDGTRTLPEGRHWVRAKGGSTPRADGSSRGRRYVPDEPTPGGVPQPGSSWDPEGHWEVDNAPGQPVGKKGRMRVRPDGTRLGPDHGPLQIGAAAVGAVGAGYLIYRGVRLLPSLFPPLWPTLIPNLAVP
jgi:RHS repeat-associated protein